MFKLARAYKSEGMTAYARLQAREFEHQMDAGYLAVTIDVRLANVVD
jgi:isocitrate lyase